MVDIIGAAANVEKKVTKKQIQFRWKLRWWGLVAVHGRSTLALCSLSTGMGKGEVHSVVCEGLPSFPSKESPPEELEVDRSAALSFAMALTPSLLDGMCLSIFGSVFWIGEL
jgi:hypothetical protein